MTYRGINRDAKAGRRGPVILSELVAKTIAPLTARRGFATADLVRAWRDIVGARFAECTRPERIAWPKGVANEGNAAVLIVRVDGPRAVFFQHETGQVVERVNAFLGYAAIGHVKIVQGPVNSGSGDSPRPVPPPLAPATEARLDETLATVDGDALRGALGRLGRGVLGDERR